MKRILMSLLFVAAFALTTAVHAQDRAATTADALFREARDLMKREDYSSACPKLVESHRLDPAAGTAINLADCWEKVGRLADALQARRDALDLLAPGDHRTALVKQEIARLEPRVPRLTIVLAKAAPKGTAVVRDGIELGPGSLAAPLPVNPGEHSIDVTAPGREARNFKVTLGVGQVREVEVAPGPATAAPGSAGPERAPPTGTGLRSGDSSAQRTIGFVALGAGVIALGAAGVLALNASSKDDDARAAGCSGSTCPTSDAKKLSDDADASRTNANWLAGIGVLAAVGGLVLVFTAPTSDETARIRVGPTFSTRMVGAQLGGAW